MKTRADRLKPNAADEALEDFEDRVFNEVSRRLDIFEEKMEQKLFTEESDFDDRISRLEGLSRKY
ncbi:MAG TPA: hypothetical protein ENI23_17350 [bacterium]|nr:hypothetical protein [bacterium]